MSRRYLFFATERYALGILRPLARAIRERGDDVAWYALGAAARGLGAGERRVDSVAAVKAHDASAVFVPGNWVPDFFPGIKVEIFHGFSVAKRARHRGHFRIRGFFDLYCTQGPDTTGPFAELARRHGYFRVVETGWPKLDPLFGPATPVARPRPVILYTSTFTRGLTSTTALYEELRRLSSNGAWDWFVTFHPKMSADVVRRYRALESPHLRFVETDDVVPLLQRADVLLGDTSSIVSEFLLLHRPAVTFRNRAPGAHLLDVTRPSDVGPAIERALERPEPLMRAIRSYADRIHPYRDGRSSARVLEAADEFVERGREGLAPKPRNLWRRLRARKRLGYLGLR